MKACVIQPPYSLDLTKSDELFAYKLAFLLFGKEYSFESRPDFSIYPWNLFSEEMK